MRQLRRPRPPVFLRLKPLPSRPRAGGFKINRQTQPIFPSSPRVRVRLLRFARDEHGAATIIIRPVLVFLLTPQRQEPNELSRRLELEHATPAVNLSSSESVRARIRLVIESHVVESRVVELILSGANRHASTARRALKRVETLRHARAHGHSRARARRDDRVGRPRGGECGEKALRFDILETIGWTRLAVASKKQRNETVVVVVVVVVVVNHSSCPGGGAPPAAAPANLDMMMVSTRKTVHTASTAYLSAQYLTRNTS